MAERKVIFVAFAIEDERYRDFLKAQALNTRSPFEYIDMSVKEAYDSGWKDRVRARIKRSHGAIALVSRNSLASSGQKWEIQCSLEESVPIVGLRISKQDSTTLGGIRHMDWTWPNIAAFIDSLPA